MAADRESTYTFGPLYDLLRKALPAYRTPSGRLNVPKLAKDLGADGMSREGVYKWLRANRLTPPNAKKLVDLGDGRLKIEQLHQFVFN